jgi:hypothetical protein
VSVNPNDTTINNTERLNRRLTELQQLPDKVRKGGGGSGAEGKEGKSQGLRYKFNTGTTEVDPGSGKIALNSSTPPTAGLIRISETDANGNALGGFLAGWDDSTNTVRGQVMIRSISSETDLLIFNITGALTDKGTWDQIAVTNVTSSGTFSNEEEVLVTFTRAGDKGIDGAEGAPGTEGKEGPSGKEGPPGAATMNGFKEPCRVATTANVTISTALNPGDTVDGVVLAENDRVLVANQTTKKENGIYVVKASPARTTDADGAGELSGGTQVYVEEGTIYADRVMRITSNGAITIGTTEQVWTPLFPKDHGIVEALPTSAALVGDRCSYKVATGIEWDLIYTAEATYPWAKTGGPPLIEEKEAGVTAGTKTEYTSLACEVKTPLGGDYLVTTSGEIATSAVGIIGALSYSIGGAGAADADAVLNSAGWGLQVRRAKKKAALASATALLLRYKVSSGNGNFNKLFISIDPSRVG